MKVKSFAKNFSLCMVGFIGGVVATGYGIGKIVIRSERIQDGISKELSDWLDDILFGDVRTTRRRPTYTSYRDAYYEMNDWKEVVFSKRKDAEEVLKKMNDLVEKYSVATIADFKDLSGLSEHIKYKDHTCGWFDCTGVVVKVRDGYRIAFQFSPKEI